MEQSRGRNPDRLPHAGVNLIYQRRHPKTTWGHFMNPIKYRNQKITPVREDEEPDFGAVFDGRKA